MDIRIFFKNSARTSMGAVAPHLLGGMKIYWLKKKRFVQLML